MKKLLCLLVVMASSLLAQDEVNTNVYSTAVVPAKFRLLSYTVLPQDNSVGVTLVALNTNNAPVGIPVSDEIGNVAMRETFVISISFADWRKEMNKLTYPTSVTEVISFVEKAARKAATGKLK